MLLTALTTLTLATATPAAFSQSAAEKLDRIELEKQFEATMQGARLQGKFTLLTPNGESAPRDDLYMVSELARGEGNTWVFTAKMSYGDQNTMEIPIPVQVEWAGDTPVISVTDQAIEGMGTFRARVMIDGDRYSGTWQHGPVGGHMWGLLVRDAAEGANEP